MILKNWWITFFNSPSTVYIVCDTVVMLVGIRRLCVFIRRQEYCWFGDNWGRISERSLLGEYSVLDIRYSKVDTWYSIFCCHLIFGSLQIKRCFFMFCCTRFIALCLQLQQSILLFLFLLQLYMWIMYDHLTKPINEMQCTEYHGIRPKASILAHSINIWTQDSNRVCNEISVHFGLKRLQLWALNK